MCGHMKISVPVSKMMNSGCPFALTPACSYQSCQVILRATGQRSGEEHTQPGARESPNPNSYSHYDLDELLSHSLLPHSPHLGSEASKAAYCADSLR